MSAVDLDFRVAFVTCLVLMTAVRVFWHRRAQIFQPGVKNPEEGPGVGILRWLTLPAFALIIGAWVIDPMLLPWARIPLPEAARWAGAPIFGVGLVLLFWVHQTLGRNFSPYLRIREAHTLVTAGPYARVRHPMYTAFLLLVGGLALLSAHLLMVLTGFGILGAVLIIRTPREEAMLAEHFGERYEAYRARTGRLLPRWSMS